MFEGFFGRARGAVVLGVLPAIALTAATSAEAGAAGSKTELAKQIGASERVNFSGKLRMLSQRVVATSCNYAAGIDPEKSGAAMHAAKAEFDKIVDALEFGDPSLGINGEEKRKKTIRRIGMLREIWEPEAAKLDSVQAAEGMQPNVEAIARDSAPLLEMAKLLVVDLSAQYSDPFALTQDNAMLVDISGRQRMLAQRMSKNVCLAASDVNPEATRAELNATAQMFETSLLALRDGMSAAGIKAPPTPQIREGLDTVVADWDEMKPFVEAIMSGQNLSDQDRAQVFHGMNRMTGNMNKVVGMYSEYSKGS